MEVTDNPLPWLTPRFTAAHAFERGADGRPTPEASAATLATLSTIVTALQDDGAPYSVSFGGDTNLAAHRVAIGSRAFEDSDLTDGVRAAVLLGLTYHEVGHVREDRKYAGITASFSALGRRVSVLATDAYVDAGMSHRFPGYAESLAFASWYIGHRGKRLIGEPKLDTPDDRLTEVIGMIRYPWLRDWNAHTELSGWRAWWLDWAGRAVTARTVPAHGDIVREALTKLEDDPQPPEPEDQPDDDDKPGEDGEGKQRSDKDTGTEDDDLGTDDKPDDDDRPEDEDDTPSDPKDGDDKDKDKDPEDGEPTDGEAKDGEDAEDGDDTDGDGDGDGEDGEDGDDTGKGSEPESGEPGDAVEGGNGEDEGEDGEAKDGGTDQTQGSADHSGSADQGNSDQPGAGGDMPDMAGDDTDIEYADESDGVPGACIADDNRDPYGYADRQYDAEARAVKAIIDRANQARTYEVSTTVITRKGDWVTNPATGRYAPAASDTVSIQAGSIRIVRKDPPR